MCVCVCVRVRVWCGVCVLLAGLCMVCPSECVCVLTLVFANRKVVHCRCIHHKGLMLAPGAVHPCIDHKNSLTDLCFLDLQRVSLMPSCLSVVLP